MPERIQRKRIKGYRHPEGTVFVTRPGPLSNPFRIVADDSGERNGWWVRRDFEPRLAFFCSSIALARRAAAVDFRTYALHLIPLEQLERVRNARYLACYCDPADGMACHADVLIEAVQ